MADTFAEFFTSALDQAGYSDPAGRERFRVILVEKYAAKASEPAFAHWRNGTRTPTLGTVLAILDALGIYGDERDIALRLAAKPEAKDEPVEHAIP